MYVLRVYLRTGLTFDYAFVDPDTALKALGEVTRCRTDPQPIAVMDDAGREGHFDGKDVLAESVIDIETESRTLVRLGLIIANANADERRKLGIMDANASGTPANDAATNTWHDPAPAAPRRGALNDLLPPVEDEFEPAAPNARPRFSS